MRDFWPTVRWNGTLLAACLLLADPNGFVRAAEQYSLAYQFTAGQRLEYTISDEKVIEVQVGETADTIKHVSESGKILGIIEAAAGQPASIDVMIGYVKMSAEGQGERIEWDSRSGEDTPLQFLGVQSSVGKPLGRVRVAASGEIAGISAGNESIQETKLDLFPLLPSTPVAVGDTWNEPFEVEILASPTLKKKVSLQRVYTLKSVTDGRATISVRTIVLTPVRDPKEEGQLVQRTPSGTFVIDIAQGLLVERELKLDNRVVGFQGPQTFLHVTGIRRETLASQERIASGE